MPDVHPIGQLDGMREARGIVVEGVVQGVGFRPWVHRLATAGGLGGYVRNDAAGVRIRVEGDVTALEGFLDSLANPPPLARVDRVRVHRTRPRGLSGFRILASRVAGDRTALVPPDTATCPACLKELFDPADRRYRHPFLNCTHCGPRLTIVRAVPYDRRRTTMASFRMCGACRREYEDPSDRRFHAQPTACPDCGPRLELLDASGRRLAQAARAADRGDPAADRDPLLLAVEALQEGRILAVKGLGGWHLACDATSAAAVARLRERKAREAKPLAIMARDVSAVRELCRLDAAEEALLRSPRAPIVLLEKRPDHAVADEVAPGDPRLGVMLPYTPLHHLLLAEASRPLVMTSGNPSGEPIAYRDEDALRRLSGIADLFLTHDRPIHTRADDSVWRVCRGVRMPIRRSRGWVPEPVELPVSAPVPLLAFGGHLKNTFCFVRGKAAFPSQHLGDLETPEALQAFREGLDHYARLLDVRPAAVAHDLHPGYLSTAEARERAARHGLEQIPVQHHHAHVAGCLAEHGHSGSAIGVAFDGTGYGSDGTVWGGEVLVADLVGFERAAHLRPVPLPGGEAAVRQPWRMAAAHLRAATDRRHGAERRLRAAVGEARWDGVLQVLERPTLSPPTSSVGRLFDAVAALLDLCLFSRYEGEAAMAVERAADPAAEGTYPVALSRSVDTSESRWIWDPAPILHALLSDLEDGRTVGTVAGRFHNTLVDAVVELCGRIGRERGLETVALTGGCFQNGLLTARAATALEAEGFRVLLHRRLPPNDGGLSYGQAAVAAARLASDRGGRREPAARAARARKASAGTPTEERAGAIGTPAPRG